MRRPIPLLSSRAAVAALLWIVPVAASGVAAAGAQAPAAAPLPDLRPGTGEMGLRGVIDTVLAAERRLVLSVTEVTQADGTPTPLHPARSKSIVISPKTVLRAGTGTATGNPITLADLRQDDTVALVGKSAGEGKAMTARALLTVEDPRVNLLPPTTEPSAWAWGITGSAKGSLTEDAGALKLTLTAAGSGERDAHLGKGNLNITQGHIYALRFRARAEKPTTVRIVSLASWPDRETGLNETLEIGTAWKEYRVRFVTSDPSPDRENALDFWVGTMAGTLYLADASLRDVTRPVVRPVNDPLLQGLLNDLKSPDKFLRKRAADKLAAVAPDENRDAVAQALVGVFYDPDLFVRWGAVKAMGVWATNDTIPALVKKLSDPEHAVRWAAMESLGPLKDRRAAGTLAAMVARGQDRAFAAAALRAMGSVAVEVAVKLLTVDAWEARMEACKILALHGGRESLPALRRSMRDSNGIVRMAAEDAVRSVAASGR